MKHFLSVYGLLGLVAAASIGGKAHATPPDTIELPGPLAFPESVTSTSDGTLYAGSFSAGGIFRARPGEAKAEIWVKPGAQRTRSILGVLADEKAGILWACSDDMSSIGVAGPSHIKGGWLKGFDLKNGVEQVSRQLPGEHATCNDMVIGPDNAIYITDSTQPNVLRFDRKTQKLDIWFSDPLFAPPANGAGIDGLAFGADGNLYLDTFTNSTLLRLVVQNGKPHHVVQLKLSRPLVLSDALRSLGADGFLMIEGGGRLDHVVFTADTAEITTLRDGLLGPTSVTLIGQQGWISEGQLSHLADKPAPAPVLPFQLKAFAITLP